MRRRTALAVAVAAVAWGGAVLAPVAPAGAATPVQRVLYGMSARSSSDIWAVGASYSKTLIRHWNGSGWKDVAGPNPGYVNVLNGAFARAANDAWAVGEYRPTFSGHPRTLIAHWDGTSWTQVTTPNPTSNGENVVYAVAALAANNAWAVGYTGKHSLALHWDGTSWHQVATPGTTGATLTSLAVVSASNIWAVGNFGTHTLVVHWNGTTWKSVKSPNPSSKGNYLAGVSAVSANNVWAVGTSGSPQRTLVEHWNGSSWKVVRSANASSSDNQLLAVSAASKSNIWAVGTTCCTSYGGAKTLTEHWNGTSWRVVSSPNPSRTGDVLAGVAAAHVSRPCAVGNIGTSNGGAQVLALRWTGTKWATS